MNKSNLHLKRNPTLRDFQEYVAKMIKERGFDKETVPEVFMLLFEECGEMAKAARKTQTIKSDKNSKQFYLEHEAANDYYQTLPKKRIAAGALFFNDNDELLILKPTYKDHWSIPGGVVDENESPRQACIREIKEEIGLDINIERFLCVNYISVALKKDEFIVFIFYGGILTPSQIKNIKLPEKEISEYKFLKTEEALSLLSEGMRQRIPKCLKAIKNITSIYLENFY